MTTSRTILVVKGTVEPGTCKYCFKGILWAKTAPHGRSMPFDREPIYASEERNLDTGVQFERWPAELLHFTTCTRRPERAKIKRPPKRTGPIHSILEPGI